MTAIIMPDSPSIPVTAAVIRRAGKVLVASRPEGSHLAGHWEFPGGRPHASESLPTALRRELREELDLDVLVFDLLWRETHRYSDKTVELHFFRCMPLTPDAEPMPREGQQVAWVEPRELITMQLAPADFPFARWLGG